METIPHGTQRWSKVTFLPLPRGYLPSFLHSFPLGFYLNPPTLHKIEPLQAHTNNRSLIALSLILALLQFKPAPMYILDEVDAALDLSHTQNIGRLIKTRFKGSQFIVVSLKDGMFQNANRIFRTRFSEGTSVVQALTPADLKWLESFVYGMRYFSAGGGNWAGYGRGLGVTSRCSFLPVGECVCVHRRFVHEDSKGWVLTYPM